MLFHYILTLSINTLPIKILFKILSNQFYIFSQRDKMFIAIKLGMLILKIIL
jgi:hypothetical protein